MIQLRRYTPEFYKFNDLLGIINFECYDYSKHGIKLLFKDDLLDVLIIPEDLYVKVIMGFGN